MAERGDEIDNRARRFFIQFEATQETAEARSGIDEQTDLAARLGDTDGFLQVCQGRIRVIL